VFSAGSAIAQADDYAVMPLEVASMWLLLQAEPVILLDPNTLSEDGTVALKDAVFRCMPRAAGPSLGG
jgi:hypothetical protein